MVCVYLFVPNLIGYFRVTATIIALAVAQNHPVWCLLLYATAFVLDAADGHAARMLGQCSSFGALLDMATDRAATSGFLAVLSAMLYNVPGAPLVCSCLVMLDIASHFCRMYASALHGKASHKDVSHRFSLLYLYYKNRRVMASFCIGQEACYLAVYALLFWNNTVVMLLAMALAPLCFLKQVTNLLQLIDGMMEIAEGDEAARQKK